MILTMGDSELVGKCWFGSNKGGNEVWKATISRKVSDWNQLDEDCVCSGSMFFATSRLFG